MFSFFKKKEVVVEAQPAPVPVPVKKRGPYKKRAVKQVDLPCITLDNVKISNDERRIAIKYGLSFEQFVNMRAELRAARKIGRPVGSKTRKRRSPKKKAQTNV
jgi:hypothetical protein